MSIRGRVKNREEKEEGQQKEVSPPQDPAMMTTAMASSGGGHSPDSLHTCLSSPSLCPQSHPLVTYMAVLPESS